MNFDKNKVYTTLNAEELKVGSNVIVADNLLELKEAVLKSRLPKTIEKVEKEDWEHRFLCIDGFHYNLAYLIEEPLIKWFDFKLGDVITDGKHIAMVTEIDEKSEVGLHIFAGHVWLNDEELTDWIKVK